MFKDYKVVGYSIEGLLTKYGHNCFIDSLLHTDIQYLISDYFRYKVAAELVKEGPCIYFDFDIFSYGSCDAWLQYIQSHSDYGLFGKTWCFVATKPTEKLNKILKYYEDWKVPVGLNESNKYSIMHDGSMLLQATGYHELNPNEDIDGYILSLVWHYAALACTFNPTVFSRLNIQQVKVNELSCAPGIKNIGIDNTIWTLATTRFVAQDFSLKPDSIVALPFLEGFLVGSLPYFFILLTEYHEKIAAMRGKVLSVHGPTIHIIRSSIKTQLPYDNDGYEIYKTLANQFLQMYTDANNFSGWTNQFIGVQPMGKRLSSFRFHIDSLVDQRIADYFGFKLP